MSSRHFPLLAFTAAVCLAVGIVGCGGSRGGSDEEYKAAITSYMAAKSMGMVVSSIHDAEADGDTAVVTAKVKDAEGLYNMAVTWRFNMERRDGKWVAVSHSQR